MDSYKIEIIMQMARYLGIVFSILSALLTATAVAMCCVGYTELLPTRYGNLFTCFFGAVAFWTSIIGCIAIIRRLEILLVLLCGLFLFVLFVVNVTILLTTFTRVHPVKEADKTLYLAANRSAAFKDSIFKQFQCCGLRGHQIYEHYKVPIPNGCHDLGSDQIFRMGCRTAITENIRKHQMRIAAVVTANIFLQFSASMCAIIVTQLEVN